MGQITNSALAKKYGDDSCLALVAALRQALKDEHDAVNTYMELIKSYEAYGDVNVKPVLEHIRDEEIDHEGEIMQLVTSLEKVCKLTTIIKKVKNHATE